MCKATFQHVCYWEFHFTYHPNQWPETKISENLHPVFFVMSLTEWLFGAVAFLQKSKENDWILCRLTYSFFLPSDFHYHYNYHTDLWKIKRQLLKLQCVEMGSKKMLPPRVKRWWSLRSWDKFVWEICLKRPLWKYCVYENELHFCSWNLLSAVRLGMVLLSFESLIDAQ